MNPNKKKTRKQRFGADGMAAAPIDQEEQLPVAIDGAPPVEDGTTTAPVKPVGFEYDDPVVPMRQEPVAYVPAGGVLPMAPKPADSPERTAARIAATAKGLLDGGTITQAQYQTVTGSGLGGQKRKNIYMKGDKLMCEYDNKSVTTIAPDGTEKATTWTILGVTWTKLYWVAAFLGVALVLAVLAIWANKK